METWQGKLQQQQGKTLLHFIFSMRILGKFCRSKTAPVRQRAHRSCMITLGPACPCAATEPFWVVSTKVPGREEGCGTWTPQLM